MDSNLNFAKLAHSYFSICFNVSPKLRTSFYTFLSRASRYAVESTAYNSLELRSLSLRTSLSSVTFFYIKLDDRLLLAPSNDNPGTRRFSVRPNSGASNKLWLASVSARYPESSKNVCRTRRRSKLELPRSMIFMINKHRS